MNDLPSGMDTGVGSPCGDCSDADLVEKGGSRAGGKRGVQSAFHLELHRPAFDLVLPAIEMCAIIGEPSHEAGHGDGGVLPPGPRRVVSAE
jgi:hypothetical protein